MSDELHLLNHKIDSVSSSVTEMKSALKELATAVAKLTLIEERQLQAAAAIERAFKTIEKIEARLKLLEDYAPSNKRVSVWIDRATWAGLGLLAMLLFKKSGLI